MEDSTKVWMESLANRKEGTRANYQRHFEGFMEYTGKTADQLRQLKYEEDQNSKPWERNKVENLVRGYLQHLKDEKGLKNVEGPYYSVRSFFSCNGLPLSFNHNDTPKSHSSEGSSVPTVEDIRKVLDAAEFIRDRAIILFLKDTGLRASDLPKLTWNSFKPVKEGFHGFKIVTEKEGVLARGFVGPETTKTLQLYKKKRLQGTRRVAPEKDIENHPIFALLNHGDKPMTNTIISARLSYIFKLAGMRDKGVSAHGLRKFWEQHFKTQKEAYQKQFNGRALTKVEKAYSWLTVEQLFDIYKQNYDDLRVLSTPIAKEVDKLRKEYEAKLEKLRSEHDKLSAKYQTLSTLVEQMSNLYNPQWLEEKIKTVWQKVKATEKI